MYWLRASCEQDYCGERAQEWGRWAKRLAAFSLAYVTGCVESFNESGGRSFFPVVRGDGTKLSSPGDIFYQPSSEMSCLRGKLADQVGDLVVLSPEGAVLATCPRTESSNPSSMR